MSQTGNNKQHYKLIVYSEGIVETFYIDEDGLDSFEQSYDSGEEIISFRCNDDGASVFLRNQKISGYLKVAMSNPDSQTEREPGMSKSI